VTLIDAFRIKELNLLIFSFLFRQTHNSYIRHNSNYTNTEDINDTWYGLGAVIGVLATGLMTDLVTKNKNFLTIFILNIVLFFWDIYLFVTANNREARAVSSIFSVFLGAILASADLIYLILIPMLIAKQHSQKMAVLNQTHRVCFAGTIVGVVLALCEVGKFLFSDNVATFLNYLT
jgi:sugar phosphate permease